MVRSSVTAMLGNLEGGSFTRDVYVEEGSGDGHLPHRVHLEKLGGGLTGTF